MGLPFFRDIDFGSPQEPMRRFFISFTGKREREWCNKKKDRKRNVPILENLSIKKVKLYVPKLLDLSDFFSVMFVLIEILYFIIFNKEIFLCILFKMNLTICKKFVDLGDICLQTP